MAKILIVDDEKSIRITLREFLEKEGYEISLTENGIDCLKKLKKESFDVITLFEVLEHLKDPLSLFKECHRILCSDGLLVIRTGNTDSWTFQYMKDRWKYFSIREHGGHISFFNPVSIRKLAERSGFTLTYIKTHRVCFYERGDIPFIYYRLIKIVSDLLNAPAALCGKGHEMRV